MLCCWRGLRRSCSSAHTPGWGPSLSRRLSRFGCTRQDDGFPCLCWLFGTESDCCFPEGAKTISSFNQLGWGQRQARAGPSSDYQRSGWGRNFIHLSLPAAEETSWNRAALWIFNCSVIRSKTVALPAQNGALQPPQQPFCLPHSCLHYQEGRKGRRPSASLSTAHSDDLVLGLLSESRNCPSTWLCDLQSSPAWSPPCSSQDPSLPRCSL